MYQTTLTLIVALICLVYNVNANQTSELSKARSYLEKQNEVFFSFKITPSVNIKQLSTMISLSHCKDSVMYAYANSSEFTQFLSLDIGYTVERSPGEEYSSKSMYQGSLDDYSGQKILNYSDYVAFIKKCETDYPDICKVIDIGKSIKNKEILCLRLTSGIKTNENPKRPRFFFACAVHGNELNGTLLGYGLIDFLVKGYRNHDVMAKKYLESIDLFIAPHLNPDGAFPNGNTTAGCIRANSAGVDLNRNYPAAKLSTALYDCVYSNTQQETKVTIAFEEKYRFNFAVDNHDAMKYIITHWAVAQTVPVDMPWIKAVGGRFTSKVGWQIGQAAMNPSPAPGTRMDWQPFYNHCWGFTLEYVNQGPTPQVTWSQYKDAILGLLDDALCGITGTVVDGSGKGVSDVKIQLKKGGTVWDKDNSEAYSREDGYFMRYAPAGTYDVVFSKDSKSRTFANVTVVDGKPYPLEVNLDNTDIVSKPCLNHSFISCNATQKGLRIYWNLPTQDNSLYLSIYSINGSCLLNTQLNDCHTSSFLWNHSLSSSQTVSGAGCFIVRIKTDTKIFQRSFLVAH